MKKGFTLIELLAVILILGIITLIAIPKISDVIKESKTNSYKLSKDNILKVEPTENLSSFHYVAVIVK